MTAQRGGFVLGVIVGLLIGLSIALGVALYITKAPVPFVNKVPQRTAEQDQAEAARNRNWDPNAPLAGKTTRPVAPAVAPGSSAAGAGAASAALPDATGPAARNPAAILAGSVTPGTPAASAAAAASAPVPRTAEGFAYFVQAGAYTRADEAEQQRAKLALLGQPAKITERDQNGRVVYRVRVGPVDTRPEAERLQGKLQQSGIETQLVRVER